MRPERLSGWLGDELPAVGSGVASLPLATLLSHTLVAFTIELDNEFERQMPHRTTRHGATAGAYPADRRSRPPRAAWLIRATPQGRQAQEVWRPLFGAIEDRWRARFGAAAIDRLRDALLRAIEPAGSAAAGLPPDPGIRTL